VTTPAAMATTAAMATGPSPAGTGSATDLAAATVAARQGWAVRVGRVGSLVQAGFAGWWLARAVLATTVPGRSVLAAAGIVGAATVVVVGGWSTRGLGDRPTGPAARSVERKLTVATIGQLAASVGLGAAAPALHRPALATPLIVISLGVLFWRMGGLLSMTSYRTLGAALMLGPAAVVAACPVAAWGPVSAGVGGLLLMASALRGLTTVRRMRTPRRTARLGR
jgi:hypothetical protein